MMYPRGSHKPTPCRYCKGSGRIEACEVAPAHECTSCNGTGIDGNPGWLVLLFIVMALAWAFALTKCS